MSNKLKYTNVRTGEVLEFDPEDIVTGPVKITKPKGKYITPDKLPGQPTRKKLFSKLPGVEYISEAEKDMESDETACYIRDYGKEI